MFRPAHVAVLSAVAASCLATPALAVRMSDDPISAPTTQPSFTTISQPPAGPPEPWYFGVMLRPTQTPMGLGLRVSSLRSGGPACQAGLEAGDIIVAVANDPLRGIGSKREALDFIRSAVTPQPLPPGVCPSEATPTGEVVLTVLDARTGRLSEVLVEPILKGFTPAGSANGFDPSITSVQPTVIRSGSRTISIPATFDPLTGRRLSPASGVATLRPIGFFQP